MLQKLPEKQSGISSMLEQINMGQDCFVGPKYNILRVIAAYPLDANIGSNSKEISDALLADAHPIATLEHNSFITSLATYSSGSPGVLSLSDMFNTKRCREESESGDADAPRNKIQRTLDGN